MPNQISPVRIKNFEGGLNLADDTLIDDNQLSVATNVFYNSEKKLQTRYGQTTFGQNIPEGCITIHNCDSVAGNGTWAGTDDAVTVSLESATMKRGAGAIKFNVTVATSGNNDAIMTNSGMTTVNITSYKGYLGFWFYTPTGGKTDLTNLVVKVGSSGSNYYSWTVATTGLTEADWVFVPLLFSSASITGTPNDAAVGYIQLTLNYGAGYTNKTGFIFDDFVAYSSGYSKPQMSLKYFKESVSPFTRHLITNVGTNVYSYDETSTYWTLIKSGVTEGARYSMAGYKNIQYYTNGSDNYASWNGQTWTEYTGANTYKGKYLLLANDVGYILGDPSVPSSLAYTNATPSNLQSFPNVLVLDEDSSDGKGTGLINLGPVVIASKEGKIYKVNIATPSREQLDYSNGALAHRAFTRVENEVFLLNDAGVYTLSQREATTGSLRSDGLSDNLQPLIDSFTKKTTAAAYYSYANNNFYLFFDSNDDDVNDTCIVFSTLTKKWTKYTNYNANEAVIYEDSSGVKHLLIANSVIGQCKEIETGFDDNGSSIYCEVQTKNFDFDIPETLKTFEMIEVFGFINGDGELKVGGIIDDVEEIAEATIQGSTYETAAGGSEALGAFILGGSALGGSGGSSGVTLYPFKARIPLYVTGSRIKIKLFSQSLNTVWILSKISLYPFAQPLEVYPTDNIY